MEAVFASRTASPLEPLLNGLANTDCYVGYFGRVAALVLRRPADIWPFDASARARLVAKSVSDALRGKAEAVNVLGHSKGPADDAPAAGKSDSRAKLGPDLLRGNTMPTTLLPPTKLLPLLPLP